MDTFHKFYTFPTTTIGRDNSIDIWVKLFQFFSFYENKCFDQSVCESKLCTIMHWLTDCTVAIFSVLVKIRVLGVSVTNIYIIFNIPKKNPGLHNFLRSDDSNDLV